MGSGLFKEILFGIYQFGVIALISAGAIICIYRFGKNLSKKHPVARWYFWTAYLFAVPIIAAPAVLFGSCFMDHVKHENMVPAAFLLINTYAIWFISGFAGSLKLYGKIPEYIAILPSVFSWVLAVGAIWGGIYLVSC